MGRLERDNSAEWYYTDSDDRTRDIQQELDQVYSQSITLNQAYWSEADLDTRFKAGDQSLYNDLYGNLPSFRKRQFYFNRIRRVANMITGWQRKNRKSTVVAPMEMSDDATASQYSKAVFWAQKRADCDEIISRAFDSGAVTTGMSLISASMSFAADPISGDINCHHVPYNSFLIDPYFKKQDLSDCNFIWRRQWLSKGQAQALLPGREDEIEKMTPRGNVDGRFQFQAESYNYAMESLLPVDEYYSRDMRPQKVLVDVETGEAIEWNGDFDDPRIDQFLEQNASLTVTETQVPTVKVAILINGKLMYEGPTSLGIDLYPFVPVLGYYEPEIPYFPYRVQGVVRGLRDAQFLYNRRKIIELDILESQVNSGWKYKLDALVDPNDVFLEGQGKGIALKQSAQMTDAEKILPAQIPPSMIQLSEILGKEIQEISGVNEELLGSADDDKAGILSMLRQGAGLTTLQVLFDQLDMSQKQLGRIFLQTIQKNFRPAKIKRIINEEPTPQFFNSGFGKYDAEIEEGINTSTQRQMAFQQALHLRELGIPVPSDYILGLASVQDAEKLKAAVQEAEQAQQQAAQKEQEIQLAMVMAQKENLDAQAVANTGLGLERVSRVSENAELSVERRAKAIEDISDARLNQAKTLSELQNLDITRLKELVALAEVLNQIGGQAEDAEGASAGGQESAVSASLNSSPLSSSGLGSL